MRTVPTTDERVQTLAKVMGSMIMQLILHHAEIYPPSRAADISWSEEWIAQLNTAFPELGANHD